MWKIFWKWEYLPRDLARIDFPTRDFPHNIRDFGLFGKL